MTPITLDEMKAVKLMNRTDTKFVTGKKLLQELLQMVDDDYSIQVTDGTTSAVYHTLYFDTDDDRMYLAHHNGRKTRQKLRIRSYVDSNLNFLEVKTKNNHGKTKKKRVELRLGAEFDRKAVEAYQLSDDAEFLDRHLWLDHRTMLPKIENDFRRITLVNKQKTERLTIDSDLRFTNLETGRQLELPELVIIELKRDSLCPSPILPCLNRLRIFSMGFSKYCMGRAMTDPSLKQNLFKERLRLIEKI